MKVKVSSTEFVDTDKMTRVASHPEYDISLYATASGNNFYKVFAAGIRSPNNEAEWVSDSCAYDFVVESSDNVDLINSLIAKFLPGFKPLEDISD